MRKDGYHHLYRGILSPIWTKHLAGLDGLSPMDNIKYLERVKLFIGHGDNDTCINYSKSQIYYQKILEHFPDRKYQFHLKIYPHSGHNSQTSNPTCHDFLTWLSVARI